MKKVILITAIGFSYFGMMAQTEVEKVISTITQDEIKGHIYFLADDLLKGRATGTTENQIAASYLANTLRGYGVKPNPETGTFYQEVSLKRTKIPHMSFIINGNPINNIITITKAELDYNANLVNLNYGLKEDYAGKDVSGKLILVKGGSSESSDFISIFKKISEKKKLAQQAGAVGIVEMVKIDDLTWDQVKSNFNSEKLEIIIDSVPSAFNTLPHLWINEFELEEKYVLNTANELKANFKISGLESDTIVSQNVIGIIEGTDPNLKNEYVMFSAHYDHVGIGKPDANGDTLYNGARDNAVGTSTVLSMADNLSKYPAKRSGLFVFFTGEEVGLLGSQFFLAYPVVPLEQIVYLLNSDNVGYNDTSLVTIVGLDRTTVAPHFKKAAATFGLTAIDDPAPDQEFFNRSDNAPFAAKGIPAPTFFMGFKSFDDVVKKYYHQPGDEAHTLDYDYLLKFFQTYVLVGRFISNDPITPFWTPGDEYEEAGKKLYDIKE